MKWEKRQRDEKVPWDKDKNNGHISRLIGVKNSQDETWVDYLTGLLAGN